MFLRNYQQDTPPNLFFPYTRFDYNSGSLGLLLANFSVYVLLNLMPHSEIIQYGWRIPFLISTFFWLILFFIRNKIVDQTLHKDAERPTLVALITNYKSELVNTFIISSLSASAFYITFIFMPTFLSSSLQLHTHQKSILITFICLVTYILALPLGGFLADKYGIMRQIKMASFLYLIFSYACFAMIPVVNGIGCIAILVFFAMIQAMLNSALPAFMVKQFQPAQRGKALAISYSMSLTIFGGLVPKPFSFDRLASHKPCPVSL
jgi:MHS family proline/betaine transporter-like MFS transporter